LARLFIKEVKILNDKIDVEFFEFPELVHQEPVQILKEPSIRGAILMAVSNSFKVSFHLIRTKEKAGKIKLSFSPILDG